MTDGISSTRVAPCQSCGSRIFWRDNQAGKVHCAGCLEPASRVIVAIWLHVVPDKQSTELDLFGDPVTKVDSWRVEAIDPYADSDGGSDGGVERGGKERGGNGSNVNVRGEEGYAPSAIDIDEPYNQALDDAIMWFKAKRLSGEIAVTHGRRGAIDEATEDEKRPPTPKGASEFYLLRGGRIVEGAKAASKHKTVTYVTFDGAEKWYRVKHQVQVSEPAKAKQSKRIRSNQ